MNFPAFSFDFLLEQEPEFIQTIIDLAEERNAAQNG